MPVIPAPELPAGGRFALLIGTSVYADARLGPLSGPAWDVEHLAEVLGDPQLGGFAVATCVDPTAQQMRIAIESFLKTREHQDLAVVYLSGHGILDRYNELYFAASDTDQDLVAATGLEAEWLRARLSRCSARRQVLILDCCHAGAYPGAKNSGELGLERLADDARGRLVMHAARASETAFTAEPGDGGSVYTRVLVEGLRSGEADLDRDGYVAATELHVYAEQRLKELGAAQRPQVTVGHGEGTILLSRSPGGQELEPASLPDEIREDLSHPRPGRRIGAVIDLAEWLDSPDPAKVVAARMRLEEVVAEDIPQVAQVALERLTSSDSGAPVPAEDVAPAQQASGAKAPGPGGKDTWERTTRARMALDEAEELAVGIADPYHRALALARIGAVVASLDLRQADRLYRQVVAAAVAIDEGGLGTTSLAEITTLMAASHRGHADEVVAGARNKTAQWQAMAGIGLALAVSDPDLAESIAAQIADAGCKAQVLARVAVVVATSDPDRAEHIASGILILSRRLHTLVEIAMAVAAFDPDRAEHIAAGIEDVSGKARALAGIASVVAASNRDRAVRWCDWAERIATRLQSNSRSVVRSDIAAAVAVFDPDRAEKIADDLGGASWRAWALTRIAPVVAGSDPGRAENIADRIVSPVWRVQALAEISSVTALSDPDRAERIVADIAPREDDTMSWKVYALASMAKAWLEQ